jgi:predicted negative regulator of RcsB-dependent stress response
MNTRRETLIISASTLVAIAILGITYMATGGTSNLVWIVLFGITGLGIVMGFQYLNARNRTQSELTGGEQYRRLVEEYRRLADMALTTQEHTDLKLGDLSAQLDHLREQMTSLQKILKDVE